MKRSARRKKIVTLCSVFLALLFSFPFNVLAEYSYDYQQAFAYAFWGLYGFTTVSPSTSITGSLHAYEATGSFSLMNNTVSDPQVLQVYDRNNNYLGRFKSFDSGNIYFLNSSGNAVSCTGCYIGIEVDNSAYSNNVKLNIGAEALTIVESGQAYIPYLTQSSTFPTVTEYNNTMQQFFQNDIGTDSDDSIILSFIINKTVYVADSPVFYDRYLGSDGYSVTRPYNQNLGYGSTRMCLYTYEIKGVNPSQTNNYFTVQFPSLEGVTGLKVLPIYFGARKNLTEDLGKMIGIDVGVTYILEEGNTESQSAVSDNDSQNNVLSQSVSDLTNQEDAFNNNMQQNLNNINFQGSDQFLQTGLLSTSAHWVKTQYNRMVNGNVIGSLVSYALLFGLGILIVGKMR